VAIKDPNARRGAVNYTKGKVSGAIGLLNYLFGAGVAQAGYEVKTDSRGRRRLSGLSNRTTAVGGKQLIIGLKNGDTYVLHYSGTLVDWALSGAPKLLPGQVLYWSTMRGRKRFV
jgi:hypothetical protein